MHCFRISLVAALFFASSTASAQFATPTLNGRADIPAGDYGSVAAGENAGFSLTGQWWYMTWDDTNLYVCIHSAELSEPVVIYIDCNPAVPVDGGTDDDGSLVGFNYDNTNFARLPFRADFVAFIKSDYREFRRSNGAGGWTSNTTPFGAYAQNFGQNSREIAIPWNDITAGAGRPDSFNWFGYFIGADSYVYGAVPPLRMEGTIGTSAREPWYFTVDSTADGASTFPFSQISYTYVHTTNSFIQGPIIEYGSFTDLTFNLPSRFLERNSNDTLQSVRDLIIGAGEVRLGGATTALTASRHVRVLGGQLTLGTVIGGDLKINGDLELALGASLICNNRQVEFLGTDDSALTGDFTGSNRIDYLRLNKVGPQIIDLQGDVEIGSRLWTSEGVLQTNGNVLALQWTGADTPNQGVRRVAGTDAGYVLGSFRRAIGLSPGPRQFPVGTNPASPLIIDFGGAGPSSIGVISVSATEGLVEPFTADNMVARLWDVDVESPLGNYEALLTFRYDAGDITGAVNTANLRAAKQFAPTSFYPHASTWLDPNPEVAMQSYTVSSARADLSLDGLWLLTSAPDNILRVELLSFEGECAGVGLPVILRWETAAEFLNAGFNVYRMGDAAPHRRLNSFPIPALGSEFVGACYEFMDLDPMRPDEIRHYLLEDVEFSGARTQHGPISVGPTASAHSSVDDWALFGW